MPLINTQYDSIMREYARRQARSRQELEERLARIHRELPALSSLEDEITACQAGKVRAAVSQDRKQAEALDAALQELVRKREALLAAHGLKPSDLEPVYACPDCQDTGYIGEQKCHCFLQAESISSITSRIFGKCWSAKISGPFPTNGTKGRTGRSCGAM